MTRVVTVVALVAMARAGDGASLLVALSETRDLYPDDMVLAQILGSACAGVLLTARPELADEAHRGERITLLTPLVLGLVEPPQWGEVVRNCMVWLLHTATAPATATPPDLSKPEGVT